MNQLYGAIGISKQAIAQYDRRQRIFDQKVSELILQADELRDEHPGCGVEKMYYTLAPSFIGRDRFIELFMDLGYRLKQNKNYRRTTFATAFAYPNLIEGLTINGASQVWQSDITYIPLGDRFCYAVFIIDVYTREIVGYAVNQHMRAEANLEALRMALKKHPPPDIHHSDRGSQYIAKAYVQELDKHNTQISMGMIAQENAYAERINGTIKNEYLSHWKLTSFNEVKNAVKKAVKHYNQKRIHQALKRKTPQQTREESMDKNYNQSMTIFEYNPI